MAKKTVTRKPKWEIIHSEHDDILERTSKMRVEGGYLYKSIASNLNYRYHDPAVSMVFVPDTAAKKPK